MNREKKIKKCLVKSKNGKYLKSKIYIKNENSDAENKTFNKINSKIHNNKINNNNNINKNKEKEKEKIYSKKDIINLQNNFNSNEINKDKNILESKEKEIETSIIISDENDIEFINNYDDNINFELNEEIDIKLDIENKEENENHEKIIKDIVSNNDINKLLENNFDGKNTIMIESESTSKILEKNVINVKWCKLCNIIVRNI